jgi:4-hydroxy-tetrahydrodipicolinate synthase
MPPDAPVFRGIGVALVTLFDAHREVDYAGTAAFAARLVELGVDALVVAGTTGEADALDDDERLRLFAAVREVAGDTIVVGGTGAASTHQAARLTARAGDTGVDAVIARSPRGLVDPAPYYRELADAAGSVPVLAYHFPAVSPPGIPVEVLSELPIAGVKDSSGDAGRLVAELGAYDGPLYVGSSAYLALAGPLGATGAILSLANTDPEGCIAALAGDMEAQRALLPGHRESRIDFPAGLKRRLARMAGTPPAVRAS